MICQMKYNYEAVEVGVSEPLRRPHHVSTLRESYTDPSGVQSVCDTPYCHHQVHSVTRVGVG